MRVCDLIKELQRFDPADRVAVGTRGRAWVTKVEQNNDGRHDRSIVVIHAEDKLPKPPSSLKS